MSFTEGCLICGKELDYKQDHLDLDCFYCGVKSQSNVSCPDNHFVCDSCHSGNANDLIESYCVKSDSINPIEIANTLMRNPKIKMHGPEHHYLVPAVLLSAYYNKTNTQHKKPSFLRIAKKRAESVLGGFCGTHGNCGAAVGTGIFISIITGNTPLADKEWQLSNAITGKTLLAIAEQGGPRCCKRDSYISILNAIHFLKENFDIELDRSEVVCEFSDRNKQCKFDECQFYKKMYA